MLLAGGNRQAACFTSLERHGGRGPPTARETRSSASLRLTHHWHYEELVNGVYPRHPDRRPRHRVRQLKRRLPRPPHCQGPRVQQVDARHPSRRQPTFCSSNRSTTTSSCTRPASKRRASVDVDQLCRTPLRKEAIIFNNLAKWRVNRMSYDERMCTQPRICAAAGDNHRHGTICQGTAAQSNAQLEIAITSDPPSNLTRLAT